MSYIVEGFVRLYLEPFSLDAQSYGPLKGATCYTDSSRNRHLLLGIGLFSMFSAVPINAFHLHNWRLPLNANRTRDVMRLAYRHRTSSTTEPPYHILLQQQLRQAESERQEGIEYRPVRVSSFFLQRREHPPPSARAHARGREHLNTHIWYLLYRPVARWSSGYPRMLLTLILEFDFHYCGEV